MKNKSVLKITNSTPRRIHLKRGTHKSHPLGFPLYSGFSSYIYIYIYTHMCRYIGVDRGRYTNSLVPPLSVSVYHCQGNVAKFRCNNGSLFSRGRQPRFLFGDPAKSTSPRNEGEGEETWPSKRNGGKRERERELEHEGRGISLRVTTLFALARNQRLAELTRSPLRAH